MAWLFSLTSHHIDGPLMRLSNGRISLLGPLSGLPIILLTTTGAKTKQPRTLPIIGIPDGEKIVLIGTNWGRKTYPGWYHNLQAAPAATVSANGQTGEYAVREAEGVEREEYWRRAVNLYSGYAAYLTRIGARRVPVMVLTPKK